MFAATRLTLHGLQKVNDTVVQDLHTFWHAGRPRCEHHVRAWIADPSVAATIRVAGRNQLVCSGKRCAEICELTGGGSIGNDQFKFSLPCYSLDPGGRQRRIERHVSGTGLPDAEDGSNHVRGPLQPDAHEVARLDTPGR